LREERVHSELAVGIAGTWELDFMYLDAKHTGSIGCVIDQVVRGILDVSAMKILGGKKGAFKWLWRCRGCGCQVTGLDLPVVMLRHGQKRNEFGAVE
jgi:hypothetical protein